MKRLQDILREITQLTSHIETNYPELYRYLHEDPLTINTLGKDQTDVDVFEQYLDTLKTKLKTYLSIQHSRQFAMHREAD